MRSLRTGGERLDLPAEEVVVIARQAVVFRPVHGPVTIQITRAISPGETVSAAHGRVGLTPVPVS